VIYSPHGPEILRAAQEELKTIAPNAQLDWHFFASEEALQRLIDEKGHPAADIWWGGPQFTFIRGAKAGLLTPYKPTWVAHEPAADHDDGDRWYGDMQTPLTMFYQKDLVQPADLPKDWDDLLKPTFKGRMIVRYPTDSGTMRALYLALIDRQVGKGKSLDEALAWMKQLEAAVARYVPYSQEMFTAVGRGTVGIGLWNLPEIVMRTRQGYPLGVVYPAGGMPNLLDCIALVQRPDEHPLARKFYELVTAKAFAEKLAEAPYNRLHTRTDLGGKARPDYLRDPRFRLMTVDWKRISEQETTWMSRWEKEVAPGKPAH
jgi:iron(III) transport system substrate-binding protein